MHYSNIINFLTCSLRCMKSVYINKVFRGGIVRGFLLHRCTNPPEVIPLLVGEGSEEIGNMIQNYIKEIEELRYHRI